ncbi:hypothetical protein C8Q74DRAFT_1208500 [Fomes fomentarius]|nr:hypothetical protein C8Q74DRAFT_1208500 [Fomes fomentarius]
MHSDCILELLLKSDLDCELTQMAIDFLSAPASSTEAEQSFSSGCVIVSQLCHVLSDLSVCISTVLGSWEKTPNLILEKKILRSFHVNQMQNKGADDSSSENKSLDSGDRS